MELSNERNEAVFDVDLTDEEVGLLLDHANSKITKGQREELLCGWAILDLLKEEVIKYEEFDIRA